MIKTCEDWPQGYDPRMGRRKSYDRGEVLEKAMRLFWAKGFEGTHLGELVEVTGVNRFGLYSEFGGKEGLFQEALQLYLKGARDAYRSSLSKEPMGLDNIRNYFRSIEFSSDYHGCFMINTLTEKNIVSPEAFEAAKGMMAEIERMFLNNLAAAQASGAIEPDMPLAAMSKMLMAVDSGIATYGIVSPSNADKEDIVSQVLRLFDPSQERPEDIG